MCLHFARGLSTSVDLISALLNSYHPQPWKVTLVTRYAQNTNVDCAFKMFVCFQSF